MKDQATRDREAADNYADENSMPEDYHNNHHDGLYFGFLAGKLHERQNPSDEVRELVDALKQIAGKHELYQCDDQLDCQMVAEEALTKFEARTKDLNISRLGE